MTNKLLGKTNEWYLENMSTYNAVRDQIKAILSALSLDEVKAGSLYLNQTFAMPAEENKSGRNQNRSNRGYNQGNANKRINKVNNDLKSMKN